MNKTQIEWALNPDGTQGYTWNPITGCLNGCPYCYARKLANTRLRGLYCANTNLPTHKEPGHETHHSDPFHPRFWESRIPKDRYVTLKQIDKVRAKPRGIFVCDMSDLFGIGIPEEWQAEVFRVINFNPWHRFYLLTKQPQNLIKWSPFPDNCYVGVTVTTNGDMTRALTNLAGIEARVKYLSIEPLLGAIGMNDHMSMKGLINQVIIGAQTRPYKPPEIEWVREIVEACDKAGVAVFLKDNLKPLAELIAKFCGKETWELRQEMPK